MSLSGISRRVSVAALAGVERQGRDPWVVEVLRWGYPVPLQSVPPLSVEPISFPSYGYFPSEAKPWSSKFRLC